MEFKRTKIMPKLNWKQEYTFHYPKKGSLKQWFAFIEGVHRLKYGYNKEYLLALMKLIKVHEEKRTKPEKVLGVKVELNEKDGRNGK